MSHDHATGSLDEAYTDYGTVLPPDTFAIVLHRDGECHMCIPKLDDSEKMPDVWVAATMVGIKFMHDREWVDELVQEFSSKRDN